LGTVQVRGIDAFTAQAKCHVGYCPDCDAFYEEMSGRQFVRTMARLCGYTKKEACQRTELALDTVDMGADANRRLRGYSKGMRQRIKLAQALVHDPELLILDEPLSGIDPVGRHESIGLFHKLAAMGKCLLISSHELETLEKITDHVIVMVRGRIAAVGTLAQIRELFEDQPLSIRIDCSEQRRLSSMLIEMDDVTGLEVRGGDSIVVRARNSKRFFKDFAGLVLEENFDIMHVETLDDSAQAILGYVLAGQKG
jgi:ABC-2 type transport system ATP-binding protein